ncbi:helix-turn-helix domain-containing protein [Nonomuraea recticatena]|uniref:HTH cro/C1-type domain-containing protein n=1 Tax=Nonomuraea recticatena TaxID=46178 RepID=A0ABP6EJ86_9ACTN
MDHVELGRHLRSRRTALGRTVASVAIDAGLSVPYVANLENGRGNPTLSALNQIAHALGTRLAVSLTDPDTDPAEPPLPPTLVRLTQTPHFQRTVRRLAAVREEESHQIQARLVDGLAAAARGLKRDDMSEGDWRRLLDSMVLVLAYPVE